MVDSSEVIQVLTSEHQALHRWRRDEPYPFPALNHLLDSLGYPIDASIGWIITPLAETKKRGLPRILPELAGKIVERATQTI